MLALEENCIAQQSNSNDTSEMTSVTDSTSSQDRPQDATSSSTSGNSNQKKCGGPNNEHGQRRERGKN